MSSKTILPPDQLNSLIQKVQEFHESYLVDVAYEQFENACHFYLDTDFKPSEIPSITEQIDSHVEAIQVTVRYIKKGDN